MTDRRETAIRRRMERHQRSCLWKNDIPERPVGGGCPRGARPGPAHRRAGGDDGHHRPVRHRRSTQSRTSATGWSRTTGSNTRCTSTPRAVIGWAWSVFNDYDFEENVLGFRPRTVRPLAAARRRISMLHRAESIGIDFHKTGFTPASPACSWSAIGPTCSSSSRGREQMSYLFRSGERHPGGARWRCRAEGWRAGRLCQPAPLRGESASASSSANSSRWPRCCASTAMDTSRPRCSATPGVGTMTVFR